MSLRDEDAGAHRHPAVDPAGAVGVDLSAVSDGLERGLRSAVQGLDRDWHQRRIKRRKPEQLQGSRMRVPSRPALHPHVDHQFHAEATQVVVILPRRGGADEEIVGDGGEIHAEMVSQDLIVKKAVQWSNNLLEVIVYFEIGR